MQNNTQNRKTYVIGGIIAVAVILLIIGFIADNRNKAPSSDMSMATSTEISTSQMFPATSTASASMPSQNSGAPVTVIMATTSQLTTANDAVLVVAPNGAEVWNAGSVQRISWKLWQRYLSYVTFDVSMVPQSSGCIYPMPCATKPVTIATNVATTSTLWQVGNAAGLPVGSYKAQVCFSGTNICDMSDTAFTITATATSSPACPSNYSWNGTMCAVVKSPITPVTKS